MSGAITKGNTVRLLVALAVLGASLVVVKDPTNLVSTAGEKLRGQESYKLELTSGWNYVSIPLKTDLTAKDACSFTGSENVIYRWDYVSGNWSGHNCMSHADEDFSLEANTGYAMHSPVALTWEVFGRKSPSKIKLMEGWNFVGFSKVGGEYYYAQQLCGKSLSNTLKVVEIDRWVNGAWEEYYCNGTEGFGLEMGKGYFLNAQAPDKPGKKLQTIPTLQ